MPLPSLLRLFFFFRWKCGIPQDSNIPKNTNLKYLARKKRQKTFVQGSAGAHKRRAIFQGLISQKRRGHWTEVIWGFALEPPYIVCRYITIYSDISHDVLDLSLIHI